MISERSKLRRKTEFHAFETNRVHAILPDRLFLTNYRAITHHPELIYELGIDAIVSVLEFPPLRDMPMPDEYKDMTLYHFQLEDNVRENISTFFKPFEDIMRRHRKVVIHCYAGISRSATIVIAHLITLLGASMADLTVDDLIYTVQKLRPGVCPNAGFVRALEVHRLSVIAVTRPSLADIRGNADYAWLSYR